MTQQETAARLLVCSCLPEPPSDVIFALWSHLEDTEFFRRFCDRHGVLPTVYRSLLIALGEESGRGLMRWRAADFENRLFAKAVGRELERLHALFKNESIRWLTYKGAALSLQVYGSLEARPPGDIDILVHLKDAARATQLLKSAGYSQVMPGPLAEGQEAAFYRFGEGRQFYCSANGCRVDLHWRLFGRWIDFEPGFDSLWRRRVSLEVFGAQVPTLDSVDNLVLLSLHGCQHEFEAYKLVLDLRKALSSSSLAERSLAIRRAGHRAPMVKFSFELALALPHNCRPGGGEACFIPGVQATLDRCFEAKSERGSTILGPVASFCLQKRFTDRGWIGWLIHVLRALATPSVQDISSCRLPRLGPNGYFVVRLFRVLSKAVTRLRRRLSHGDE